MTCDLCVIRRWRLHLARYARNDRRSAHRLAVRTRDALPRRSPTTHTCERQGCRFHHPRRVRAGLVAQESRTSAATSTGNQVAPTIIRTGHKRTVSATHVAQPTARRLHVSTGPSGAAVERIAACAVQFAVRSAAHGRRVQPGGGTRHHGPKGQLRGRCPLEPNHDRL